ncbi:MAG TPA: STAS domain-containing protein [Mycobacterium sp.]|nr:STAS domain-containing protein [Mycobacterium sp.]
MTAIGTTRIYRADPATIDETQRCGRATFAVRHVSSTRTAVAVTGEIDAVNGRDLGRYVERQIGASKQLVLDLRAVDFFGSAGFTALYYISVHCARSDVDWVIVGSPAVRRVLSICDPDGELPLGDDLLAGLARLDRSARSHHYAVRAE